MTPDRGVFKSILRRDFYSFVQGAFRELEPGTTFVPAMYLEVLCHQLGEVERRATTRLVVNIPPRHLKSLVTSVIWVAWMLMRNPQLKVAVICHNDSLTKDLAYKCKRLVKSDWYADLAPRVRISLDRDERKDFETTAGGGVFSASIESGITGRGFDVIILDDPQAANQAESDIERERVKTTFDSMISSRLNDPVKGAIVVVQQRLHEDDLSGYLLGRGRWTHLCLPLVATEEVTYAVDGRDYVRRSGDVLCPIRVPPAGIATLQAQLGPQIFETQYQQSPSSVQGEIIKSEYLKTADKIPQSATMVYAAVDTAAKASMNSDYTVFLLVATDGVRHYIFDVIRGKYNVAELRDIAVRLHATHRFEKFLIEDSAMGPSLHSLLSEIGKRTELVNVGVRNKQQRLQANMHLFVDGRIYIVGDAPWTSILRSELLRFPVGRHDDQVDALTLYLEHIGTKIPVKPVLLSANSAMGRGFQFTPPPRRGEHPMRPRDGRGFSPRGF